MCMVVNGMKKRERSVIFDERNLDIHSLSESS